MTAPEPAQSAEDVRWVTFRRVPLKAGEGMYLQPNETVMQVEADWETDFDHVLVMCVHYGHPPLGKCDCSNYQDHEQLLYSDGDR